MVNPREEADDQREKAKELLRQLLEAASGSYVSLDDYKIDLFINHIITAAMLEIAIAQKEAIDRAQNAR